MAIKRKDIGNVSMKNAFVFVICIIMLFGTVLSGCATQSAAQDVATPSTPEQTKLEAATPTPSTETTTGLRSLLVYAGAASKPPTEEAALQFESKTGVHVDLVFGGSGTVLSQMTLNKNGDLYFPGSSDFMEKAKADGLVYGETEQKIVYLVSAINVQKGNPKQIHTLHDLLKPGLKVAIANPETVCVGLYATEIIDRNFNAEEKTAFISNLINYTESCDKTATAISLKTVDAVIGWSVFQYWDPDNIETIALHASEIARIGYIPIAVSTFTQQRDLAQQFIDFLCSAEGQAIFKKYHYFTSSDEAVEYIDEDKPVGGEYALQEGWISK